MNFGVRSGGGDERDRAARRRRLLLPVVTLAIASAVWWWSSGTAFRRDGEVHDFAARLVAEAAPPAPRTTAIAATQPVMVDLVRQLLAEYSADGVPPTFEIRRGDAEGGDGSATHSVVVIDDSKRWAVLRIAHRGSLGEIAIVGADVGGQAAPPRPPSP